MHAIAESHATGYARRVYDDVLGWYKSADAKAQVVLTIDGAFLAFLTGTIFIKPVDLQAIVGAFPEWTWRLMGLAAGCLAMSMAAAIYCLWSRVYSTDRLRRIIQGAESTSDSQRYPPEVLWFFQMISVLDRDKFARSLVAVDADTELQALASQISILSTNVRRKHFAANLGFALAAATLILFFMAGMSYMLHAIG